MCVQVLEDRRDDGAAGGAAVGVRCVGGDRQKRDPQPNEAAEHRSALRALVDVLREAVISMHAIPSGHMRSDP